MLSILSTYLSLCALIVWRKVEIDVNDYIYYLTAPWTFFMLSPNRGQETFTKTSECKWQFNGNSIELLLNFYVISIEILCHFRGKSVDLFYGYSMEFRKNFNKVNIIYFSVSLYTISLEFRWNFCLISMRFYQTDMDISMELLWNINRIPMEFPSHFQ